MKYKILVSLMAGILMLSPIIAHADDSDLEARIAALEERVAALEAQHNISEEPATESEQSEISYENGGLTLTYKRHEVAKDHDGHDCVIIYFDFINESDDNTSAIAQYVIKAFQHRKEIEHTSTGGNQAALDWSTEIMPGADPLEVATAYQISDTSEIVVEVSSWTDRSADEIQFTLSLE